MLYLISYDLSQPDRNYDGLYEAIKKQGSWWHYLESTWIVSSTLTSHQIAQNLRSQIDDNDHLIVIQVTKDFDGWLKKDAWDWINQH